MLLLPVLPFVLAAAPLAVAQSSSLTLGGRIDLGVQRVPRSLASATDTGNTTQVAESSNGRLNFAGREEINADLTAFFVLEHRFNADTGIVTDSDGAAGAAAPFWKDKSWVGLASKRYGELKLGRVHSAQYGIGVAGRFEAFFGDSLASSGTRGARARNQWDDSVYYTAPLYQGINAGVVVQDGNAVRLRGTGVHLLVARDKYQVALTVAREQDTLVAVANPIITRTLGSWVDVGKVRLMGTYAKSSQVNEADTGDEVVYTLGMRVPAGPGELRASYRRIDDTQRKGLHDASADQDSMRLGLGYQLPLSKRTSINNSLVRERQVRYNADGSVKTDRLGTSYEAALRHLF